MAGRQDDYPRYQLREAMGAIICGKRQGEKCSCRNTVENLRFGLFVFQRI